MNTGDMDGALSLLHQMDAEKEEERIQAASELAMLHLRLFGAGIRGVPPSAPPGWEDIALRITEHLGKSLVDTSALVRREVVGALGRWGGRRALGALSELYLTEPSNRVRRACVNALGAARTPESEETIELALSDKDRTVGRDAALYLPRIARAVAQDLASSRDLAAARGGVHTLPGAEQQQCEARFARLAERLTALQSGEVDEVIKMQARTAAHILHETDRA